MQEIAIYSTIGCTNLILCHFYYRINILSKNEAVMEDLEKRMKHLETEVARLIAELRLEVGYNHDDLADIMSYLQAKFPDDWNEDGTIRADRMKRNF